MNLPVPSTQKVQEAIQKFEGSSNLPDNFSIYSQDDYEQAASLLKRVKTSQAELKELKETLTKPINQLKQNVMDMFSVPESNLKAKEIDLKKAILNWEAYLEQERAKEEARLRDEQEKSRQLAEAKALKLESKGKLEQAENVRQAAILVPTVVIPTTEKPKGISSKKIWKAEVIDAEALFQSGRREFWEVNESALRSFATATKGEISVPGVRFYQESIISAGKG